MEGGIGRVGTSHGSSGCRFFGSLVGLARETEVLLRGMLVLGNRAPLRIDGAGRFVCNLSALNHTGREKKNT
jgi:hypothetical protein